MRGSWDDRPATSARRRPVAYASLSSAERESLVAGKKLAITFEGKVMHFFDPETEKNLLL